MGKRLVALARESNQFKIVAAIVRAGHQQLDIDAGECAGIGRIGLPVTFDLRYRSGTALVSPVRRERVREHGEVYTSPFALEYCLAWEAGAAGALLDFDARVQRTR